MILLITHHVCNIVPRVGVELRLAATVVKSARAVFLEETDHGAATRTAVEPENKRRSVSILARLKKPEPEVVLVGC